MGWPSTASLSVGFHTQFWKCMENLLSRKHHEDSSCGIRPYMASKFRLLEHTYPDCVTRQTSFAPYPPCVCMDMSVQSWELCAGEAQCKTREADCLSCTNSLWHASVGVDGVSVKVTCPVFPIIMPGECLCIVCLVPVHSKQDLCCHIRCSLCLCKDQLRYLYTFVIIVRYDLYIMCTHCRFVSGIAPQMYIWIKGCCL